MLGVLLGLVCVLGVAACGSQPAPTAGQAAALARTPAAPAEPATPVPATATALPPTTSPTATASPTIVYFPVGEKPLLKIPSVLIAAPKDDARITLAHNAVDFWNGQLKALGSPFRLGAITQTGTKSIVLGTGATLNNRSGGLYVLRLQPGNPTSQVTFNAVWDRDVRAEQARRRPRPICFPECAGCPPP